MNEGAPKNESRESREFTPEELSVIEMLKNYNPEAPRLFKNLALRMETAADAVEDPKERIRVNLKFARIFHAAGIDDQAWAYATAVRMEATEQDATDLLQDAERLMDEIDGI